MPRRKQTIWTTNVQKRLKRHRANGYGYSPQASEMQPPAERVLPSPRASVDGSRRWMRPVARMTPEPKNLQDERGRQQGARERGKEGGEGREPSALGKVKDAAGNDTPQDADALRHDGEHGPDEARDLRSEYDERVRPCSRASETAREKKKTHEDDKDRGDAQRHLAD